VRKEIPSPIRVRGLSKEYHIYRTPGLRLLEALYMGRRSLYDSKLALNNLEFEVKKGEVLGIIGPNGCGKSTLLRILAGTTTPTAGEVEIHGKLHAMLDLSTGFNFEFSGRENIVNKCALLGLSKPQTERIFDSIVDFSELGERIEHPVKTYSSGMLLRLGFSIMIHMEFAILLIDEVMYVGDEIFTKKCLATLNKLKGEGKTILVSSHGLGGLANLCDRIMFLDDGKVDMLGYTEEVLQHYLELCNDRYTRIEKPVTTDLSLFCVKEKLGSVRIEDFKILNGDGQETLTFATGDPLQIRIRYEVDEPVNNPCFRVQFMRNDGTFLHGTNTYRQGMNVGTLTHGGEMLLNYDHLNLLEGDYYVNVGIWPDEYTSLVSGAPFDAWEYRKKISMKSGRKDGGGIFHISNRWELDGSGG